MNKAKKIPEWVGSTLTNGTFLAYGDRVLAAYVAVGLDQINLTALGMKLTEALDAYRLAVKRQEAYDETVAVATADNDRDVLFKALWHAWDFLQRLSPTHPLMPHVNTLRSEMNAYKGIWTHELSRESSELDGFRGALATDANRAALAALGLTNLADALWAANDAVKSAQDSRADERQHRDDEKAGSTPELRKAVSTLLVQCANRVNAVYELDPDNDKAEQAIGKVIALIEEYKRVATEAKHRKGDDPEPEPEPEPAPEA